LWAHGKRWLLMSGSIVLPSEQIRSLGAGHLDVRTVSVPMTFPVENRPIYVAPVADMAFKVQDAEFPKMAHAINMILADPKHEGERVLIHCVSYALALKLIRGLDPGKRLMFSYADAKQRENVLERFGKSEGGVMIAPSMDRGFDFKGDLARVVIVAKVPYPSLANRQVTARSHAPGGREWYTVQTVRTLLQMTGRGVRSETDTCTTYILDAQFSNNLYKKNTGMFPKWWRDAMVRGFRWTDLLTGFVDKGIERV
jgi:Rad3-related DNA helicase